MFQAFIVPTTAAASILTAVGDQFADVGTLSVIVIAAGLPLAFYVIGRLIGLLPGRRGGRRA